MKDTNLQTKLANFSAHSGKKTEKPSLSLRKHEPSSKTDILKADISYQPPIILWHKLNGTQLERDCLSLLRLLFDFQCLILCSGTSKLSRITEFSREQMHQITSVALRFETPFAIRRFSQKRFERCFLRQKKLSQTRFYIQLHGQYDTFMDKIFIPPREDAFF